MAGRANELAGLGHNLQWSHGERRGKPASGQTQAENFILFVCLEGSQEYICHSSRKNNLSKKITASRLSPTCPFSKVSARVPIMGNTTECPSPSLISHPHLCFCVLPRVDTYSLSAQDPYLFLGLVPFPWRALPPSTPHTWTWRGGPVPAPEALGTAGLLEVNRCDTQTSPKIFLSFLFIYFIFVIPFIDLSQSYLFAAYLPH